MKPRRQRAGASDSSTSQPEPTTWPGLVLRVVTSPTTLLLFLALALAIYLAIRAQGIDLITVATQKWFGAQPEEKEDQEQVLHRELLARTVIPVGWSGRAYPHLGLGLAFPSSWTANDAAAQFGGGEIELVKRYEPPSKSGLGILMRLRSVPPPYIRDPQQAVRNRIAVLSRIDPEVRVEDTEIAGRNARLFIYKQVMGVSKIGEIREYVVRLIPEVELQAIALYYTDAPDRDEFWEEQKMVVNSIVVDEANYQLRRSLLLARR